MISERLDCDRTVISQAHNLEEHRGLATHTAQYFWEVKSLIACALTRSGVAWCQWPASLSKRAQSTTLTSLRVFRITDIFRFFKSLAVRDGAALGRPSLSCRLCFPPLLCPVPVEQELFDPIRVEEVVKGQVPKHNEHRVMAVLAVFGSLVPVGRR